MRNLYIITSLMMPTVSVFSLFMAYVHQSPAWVLFALVFAGFTAQSLVWFQIYMRIEALLHRLEQPT